MNCYYVYAHTTPDGIVFYVGKGRGMRRHQTGNRSSCWKAIVRKHGYVSMLLEQGLDEQTAYEKEVEWIAYFKQQGQCAANVTNGGPGVRVAKRWWNGKISESLMGKPGIKGKASCHYKDIGSTESIVRLYTEAKWSSVRIADRLGLSVDIVLARLREQGIDIRPGGRAKAPIVCITDGRMFPSLTEAASYYDLFAGNICKVLRGFYKKTGGKVFAYADAGSNAK